MRCERVDAGLVARFRYTGRHVFEHAVEHGGGHIGRVFAVRQEDTAQGVVLRTARGESDKVFVLVLQLGVAHGPPGKVLEAGWGGEAAFKDDPESVRARA